MPFRTFMQIGREVCNNRFDVLLRKAPWRLESRFQGAQNMTYRRGNRLISPTEFLRAGEVPVGLERKQELPDETGLAQSLFPVECLVSASR